MRENERERENISEASIYNNPHAQTAVYFRLAKLSRKISLGNPITQYGSSQQSRSILRDHLEWAFPKSHYCAMCPCHDLATRRDMPMSNKQKQTEPPWRKWFYGSSDNNSRVGKTISYVWRPFSLRNPVFSSYSISLRACLLDTWGECHFECIFYNRCRVLRAKSSRYTFRSKNFKSRKCKIPREG